MKTQAALFVGQGSPLEVTEIDLEEPGPTDVLVRMYAVGLCGSDLHVIRGEWARPAPMVLGHEGSGVVEAVGSEVSDIHPGDHVVLSWAPACGVCGPCTRGRPAACLKLRKAIGDGTLPDGTTRLSLNGQTVYRMTTVGALSELIVMPAAAVLPLPAEVPLRAAALLGCAALTGVGSVRNAARVEPGSSVLVIGAGGVGQFIVQGCRIAGAGTVVVVDPVEERRALAAEFGATHVVAPDGLDELLATLAPEGVDYAFEAVGVTALEAQALERTRAGGTAVLVGMPAFGSKLSVDPFSLPPARRRSPARSTGRRIPPRGCRRCLHRSPRELFI